LCGSGTIRTGWRRSGGFRTWIGHGTWLTGGLQQEQHGGLFFVVLNSSMDLVLLWTGLTHSGWTAIITNTPRRIKTALPGMAPRRGDNAVRRVGLHVPNAWPERSTVVRYVSHRFLAVWWTLLCGCVRTIAWMRGSLYGCFSYLILGAAVICLAGEWPPVQANVDLVLCQVSKSLSQCPAACPNVNRPELLLPCVNQ